MRNTGVLPLRTAGGGISSARHARRHVMPNLRAPVPGVLHGRRVCGKYGDQGTSINIHALQEV